MSTGHIDVTNGLTVFYGRDGEPLWHGESYMTWRGALRCCLEKIDDLRARANEIEAWVRVAEVKAALFREEGE